MNLGRNDLTIERTNGDAYGYVIMSQAQVQSPTSVIHTKRQPEIPLNVGSATPTEAGGQYDVRDSNGEKSIVHYDWHFGAGQESLDAEGASAGMYKLSSCIDIRTPGKIRLTRALQFTKISNAQGPPFFALGVWWMPCDYGILMHSSDLVTWAAATYKAGDENTDAIYDMCTDGKRVYFSVATGSGVGVYAGNATTYEFEKLSTQAVYHIAYLNGMLFGTTLTGAGHFDPSTYVYNEDTMVFMSTNSSIGLSVAGNTVYWVVSQGGQCYVYSLYWDADTDTVLAQQQAEFRAGFQATCSFGYLNSVYIAGYMTNVDSDVGQGALYVYVNGSAQPLVLIGEDPESVFVSEAGGVFTYSVSAETLDNKVWAISAGEDKLYIQTSRGFYLWDIDDGGYHHLTDFTSPDISAVEGTNVADVFSGMAFDPTAFQTSVEFYQSLSTPGINYGQGIYAGTYTVAGAKQYITATQATPTVLTTWETDALRTGGVTKFNHGLIVGDVIVISHSNANPTLDGTWKVHSVPNDYELTIEHVTTGAVKAVATTQDTAGELDYDISGIAYRSGDYNAYGHLESSWSSYHTGSITKDFRSIKVSHELPASGSLVLAYNIDNTGWHEATEEADGANWKSFAIYQKGFGMAYRITLQGDGDVTPTVTSINVLWDFERVDRHQYTLDCRTGAANSRWTESPKLAIPHIWAAGNERVLFNDQFNGTYYGVIEQAEFQQASQSEKEGATGIVTLLVREVE